MADLHQFPCGHHVTRKRLVPGGRVAKEIETCERCEAYRSRSVGTPDDGAWIYSDAHDALVSRAVDAEAAERERAWRR